MDAKKQFKNGRFKKRENKVEINDNNNEIDCMVDNESVLCNDQDQPRQTVSTMDTPVGNVECENILHGRRIIDLKFFAQMMFNGCIMCMMTHNSVIKMKSSSKHQRTY